MALWLPDPRLERPEMLFPGRKPTGPVEITWINTITRGLKTALVLQDNSYRSLIRDPIYPNGWGLYSGATRVRDGVECAADNACLRSVDAPDIRIVRERGTSLMQYRYSAAAAEPQYMYFFYNYQYIRGSFYLGGTENSGTWHLNGTANGGSLPDIPAGQVNEEYVIAYDWDWGISKAFSGWVNGESITDTAGSVPSADYYCVGGRDDSTARFSNGVVKTFFQWDRNLTSAEHKSMALNPYQFLTHK